MRLSDDGVWARAGFGPAWMFVRVLHVVFEQFGQICGQTLQLKVTTTDYETGCDQVIY